jgi:hypothetical protein
VRTLAWVKWISADCADNNNVSSLVPGNTMPQLRVLRLSNNNLDRFDISLFPKIRTLYVDCNRLNRISRSDGGGDRVENLSMRNQRVPEIVLEIEDLRNVKRLYISGMCLFQGFAVILTSYRQPSAQQLFPHDPALFSYLPRGCRVQAISPAAAHCAHAKLAGFESKLQLY